MFERHEGIYGIQIFTSLLFALKQPEFTYRSNIQTVEGSIYTNSTVESISTCFSTTKLCAIRGEGEFMESIVK